VQFATSCADVPPRSFIEHCVRSALPEGAGELVVRIVDEAESEALNRRFRGKTGPTNVLAFPPGDMPLPASVPAHLGDIVICAPIAAAEARWQNKSAEAHWAHLIVHGCLHLCGYDHVADAAAAIMERRERALLAQLGVADPYRDEA
jgi:probable rRNA maturation factor